MFATADLHGPQGWWRAHVPAATLRAARHEAYSVPALTVDDRGRLRAAGVRQTLRPAQVVILQGWYHPQAPELIHKARRAGQVVLCDLDDDVWNIPAGNVAAEAAGAWRPHLEAILAACNGVTCSTPRLATLARDHNGSVWVARNGLPASMWAEPSAPSTAAPVRIGWLGRTNYRGDDLAMIAPALRAVALSEGPPVEWVHLGAVEGDQPFAGITRLEPAEVRPWTDVEGLADRLRIAHMRTLDVAVVPQRPGPFADARSNATGLLLAGSGVPFIASPTPEYELLALDGAGSLADTTMDWAAELQRFASDPDARHAAAVSGLGATGWTAEAAGAGWAEAIRHHLLCVREDADRHRFTPRGVRGS